MAMTITSARSLTSLSHEEAKHLLTEELGCDPIRDDSIFVRIRMKGRDLAVIDSVEDLQECGIGSCSRIRLKSIVAALKEFQHHGVPQSLIKTFPSSSLLSSPLFSPSRPSLLPPLSPPLPNPVMVVVSGNTSITTDASPIPVHSHDEDEVGEEEEIGEKEELEVKTGDHEEQHSIPPVPPTSYSEVLKASIPRPPQAIATEGVSYLTLFKQLNSQTSKSSPKIHLCHQFDDVTFQSLHTFKENIGTTLHQTTLQSLYGSPDIVMKILSGQYCDDSGYVLPPNTFYKNIFARISGRNVGLPTPGTSGTSTGSTEVSSTSSSSGPNTSTKAPFFIFSPYQRLMEGLLFPPISCGLVVIPNHARPGPGGCALRFSSRISRRRVNGKLIEVVSEPHVRILVKEVCTSLSDLIVPATSTTTSDAASTSTDPDVISTEQDDDTMKATRSTSKKRTTMAHKMATMLQFNQVKTRFPLHPEIIKPIEGTRHDRNNHNESESLPQGMSGGLTQFHSRIYLLWNIHTMSLMAIREGLLILIADDDDRRIHDRYHLGVLYFPTTMPDKVVTRGIEEAWKRCQERFEQCQWKAWDDMVKKVRPTPSVIYSLSSRWSTLSQTHSQTNSQSNGGQYSNNRLMFPRDTLSADAAPFNPQSMPNQATSGIVPSTGNGESLFLSTLSPAQSSDALSMQIPDGPLSASSWPLFTSMTGLIEESEGLDIWGAQDLAWFASTLDVVASDGFGEVEGETNEDNNEFMFNKGVEDTEPVTVVTYYCGSSANVNELNNNN